MSSVQYGDTVALIGGYSTGVGSSDRIYLYQPDTNQWILSEESLNQARYYLTAFLVDESIFAA